MIEVGMIVKLWDGTIGEVLSNRAVNGVLFHSVRVMAQTPWGLCPTFGKTFVADCEIVAIKQTANAAAATSAA